VVTSPAKFRKQIVDVGQAMQQESQELKLSEKKVREISNWVGNIEEAQVEVDAALEVLYIMKRVTTTYIYINIHIYIYYIYIYIYTYIFYCIMNYIVYISRL
jgi:hypothetical protein